MLGCLPDPRRTEAPAGLQWPVDEWMKQRWWASVGSHRVDVLHMSCMPLRRAPDSARTAVQHVVARCRDGCRADSFWAAAATVSTAASSTAAAAFRSRMHCYCSDSPLLLNRLAAALSARSW